MIIPEDSHESIAPITHSVIFMDFPAATIAHRYQEWVESEGFAHDRTPNRGPWVADVAKVRARKHDLPGLLKPQNRLGRRVIVPTTSRWSAVFYPNHKDLYGDITFRRDLADYASWLAHNEPRPEQDTPVFVQVTAWPRVLAEEATEPHFATDGACVICIFGLNSFRSKYRDRQQSGHEHTYRWVGHSEGRRVFNGGTLRDYKPNVGAYPGLKSEELDRTPEQVDELWNQFNFDDIGDLCGQLGIDVFNNDFYGDDGYLVSLWHEGEPRFEITDRIPFQRFQYYQGHGAEVLRADSR